MIPDVSSSVRSDDVLNVLAKAPVVARTTQNRICIDGDGVARVRRSRRELAYRGPRKEHEGRREDYRITNDHRPTGEDTSAAGVLARDLERLDDWQHVFSHDLWRYLAYWHLVEKEVPVRVMIAIGGWSSHPAIEPYLTEPSEKNTIEAMTKVS